MGNKSYLVRFVREQTVFSFPRERETPLQLETYVTFTKVNLCPAFGQKGQRANCLQFKTFLMPKWYTMKWQAVNTLQYIILTGKKCQTTLRVSQAL